jgi:hypothetical protein
MCSAMISEHDLFGKAAKPVSSGDRRAFEVQGLRQARHVRIGVEELQHPWTFYWETPNGNPM